MRLWSIMKYGFVALLLLLTVTIGPLPGCLAQEQQGQDGCLLRSLMRSRIKSRLNTKMQSNRRISTDIERADLAGLKVAIWKPKEISAKGAPLVLFSHGFHGTSTQSNALMTALSQAGYFVAAPDHADANMRAQLKKGGQDLGMRPDVSFASPEKWSESTYKNRGEDLKNLLAALKADSNYKNQIDFTRLALVGHSLGGYTVLGLAGGWRSWKLDGVKAVVALSPFCTPYLTAGGGSLSSLNVPVMYQGGTRDNGITPSLLGADGAYARTSSPAALVEFQDVGHFSFSNFNRDKTIDSRIADYAITFINHYLNQGTEKSPYVHTKGTGVQLFESK